MNKPLREQHIENYLKFRTLLNLVSSSGRDSNARAGHEIKSRSAGYFRWLIAQDPLDCWAKESPSSTLIRCAHYVV